MGKHHKSNRRKRRKRTTLVYEPMAFNGSYQRFVKTMRKSSGKMIHNPDGSVTSISSFGEIVTAIYMETEQLDERESYEEAS